jgi:amino acid transporter
MARPQKFGAFSGVFTPSILTILGVIMYLAIAQNCRRSRSISPRLGIIALAHVISFATGLSVASIATDKKVEAGGTYYMISRSLGLAIRGNAGAGIFVGLSFSVSLYLIGFSESFLSVTGFDVNKEYDQNGRKCHAAVCHHHHFYQYIPGDQDTVHHYGGHYFCRCLSLFLGSHEYVPEAPLLNMNPESRETFISLFGIFFPAVTGFEAGVSMSGDLKDPKKSIPKGSIAAIVVGFVVYVGLAFFFAYTVNREMLTTDPKVSAGDSLVFAIGNCRHLGSHYLIGTWKYLGRSPDFAGNGCDRDVATFFR